MLLFALIAVLCGLMFAEEFTFQGVPFGTSRKESVALMKQKGWLHYKYASDKKRECFRGTKKQSTYGGREIEYIFFDIIDEEFAEVTVIFKSEADAVLAASALKEKYNLKDKFGDKSFYTTDDGKVDFSFGKVIMITDVERNKSKKSPVGTSDL